MRTNFLLLLIFCSLQIRAQNLQYASPVDFTIVLAGNVGEIRSGHFHTGIDIKSPVGIGPSIKSTAAGYITRIGVSPVGYGNVLYVSHLNGTTSVYGHLNGFEAKIAAWVKQQQYARKSFKVDLYPPATMFPVKQGEVIGYLGNSGSSGGPHLHFEIRDANSNPINIVADKTFKVADNIAPEIYRATIFECDTINGTPVFSPTQSIDIKKDKQGIWKPSTNVFHASRPLYIAYELIDFMNGRSNTLGIYSLTQKVDGAVNFSFSIDKLSFASTRYVNTFIDWVARRNSRSAVLRAYVSPNNELSLYDNIVKNGVIMPPKTGCVIDVETALADNNGNVTTINFQIEKCAETAPQEQNSTTRHKADWNKNFSCKIDIASVSIPDGALYETSLIDVQAQDGWVVVGCSDGRPLQKSMTLKISALIPLELQPKALIVDEHGHSVGGKWVDNTVEAKSTQFGKFRVDYDTTPPKITYIGVVNGYLKFKITDDLSGIKNYRLTVNDDWALGEYDAKSGTVAYKLSRTYDPQNYKVDLYVQDNKNNSNELNITEKW